MFFRLFALLVPLLSAACVDSGFLFDSGTTGDQEAADRVCDGDCVSTNPQCEGQTTEDDNSRCTTCDGVEICGEPEVATCIERVDAYGEPCQNCTTATGTVVYDDCAVADVNLAAASCEPVVDANREEDVDCEICFDEQGTPLSTTCTPAFDRCEEVPRADGGSCRACYLGEEFAFLQCDPVDVEPTVCVTYGDDNGACVECFDDDGTMVLQSCSGPENGNEICESFISVDGLTCEVCTDSYGGLSSLWCEEESAATFCEVLFFTEQTCTICLGEQGQLVQSECARNDCEDPDVSCPPPPPCTTTVQSDGTVCRSCPLEQDPGIVEVQCVGDGPEGLSCVVEQVPVDDVVPPDDPNQDPGQFVAEESCLLCEAGGQQVYSRCESEGPLEPPVCEFSASPDGAACTTCFAPDQGEVVYSDCALEECFPYEGPGGEFCEQCIDILTGDVTVDSCNAAGQCIEVIEAPVAGEDGVATLLVPANNGPPHNPTANCVVCFTGGGLPDLSACSLNVLCDGSPPGADNPGGGQGVVPIACGDEVVVIYDVLQCNNPWGNPDPNEKRVLAIMDWLIESGVLPFYVQVWDDLGPQDCTSCGCPTGERVEVTAPLEDLELLIDLGFF